MKLLLFCSPRRLKARKGAVLIEVVLALLIFIIGITGSVALLINSAQTNTYNKNRIIATNLAREGLEVVKNIRDTNWLVYSANMRACWEFSPDTQEDADMSNNTACVPDASGQNNHPIGINAAGKRVRAFLADFDPTQSRWMLLPAPEYFDSTHVPAGFYPYDLTHPNGEVGTVGTIGNRRAQLWVTSDGRYTHNPAGNTATLFYRTIEIYYIDNPDSGQDQLFPKGTLFSNATEGAWRDNRFKVVSKLSWKNSATDPIYHTLSLETILTDYLNRTNWTD